MTENEDWQWGLASENEAVPRWLMDSEHSILNVKALGADRKHGCFISSGCVLVDFNSASAAFLLYLGLNKTDLKSVIAL